MNPNIRKLLVAYKTKMSRLSPEQLMCCALEIKNLEDMWEVHAVNFVRGIEGILRVTDPKDYDFIVGDILENIEPDEETLIAILVEGIQVLDKWSRSTQ
jgi:hypothetical protein